MTRTELIDAMRRGGWTNVTLSRESRVRRDRLTDAMTGAGELTETEVLMVMGTLGVPLTD